MANENLFLTRKYKEIDLSFLSEKETGFTPTEKEYSIIKNCARLGKAYVSGKLFIFDYILVNDYEEGQLQANGFYISYSKASVEFDIDTYAFKTEVEDMINDETSSDVIVEKLENKDVVTKTLYQTQPNWDYEGNFEMSLYGHSDAIFHQKFCKLALYNRELHLILNFTIENNTGTDFSASDFNCYMRNIPTEIGTKIINFKGTDLTDNSVGNKTIAGGVITYNAGDTARGLYQVKGFSLQGPSEIANTLSVYVSNLSAISANSGEDKYQFSLRITLEI